MNAEKQGASQGLKAGWYYGADELVVQSCKQLVAEELPNLQLGSHDLPQGHEAVRSQRWEEAPLVGELCCTAMLEARAAGPSRSC